MCSGVWRKGRKTELKIVNNWRRPWRIYRRRNSLQRDAMADAAGSDPQGLTEDEDPSFGPVRAKLEAFMARLTDSTETTRN